MRKFLIPLFALLLIAMFAVDASAGPIRNGGRAIARGAVRGGKIVVKVASAPFRLLRGGCGCD